MIYHIIIIYSIIYIYIFLHFSRHETCESWDFFSMKPWDFFMGIMGIHRLWCLVNGDFRKINDIPNDLVGGC